jgi:hypothetical protein
MSDRLEEDLEELLRRRAATTEAEVATQRGSIVDLPDRRRRVPHLARAAAVLVAVGLAAVAVWRLETAMVAAPPTQPPASAPAIVASPSTASTETAPEGTPPAWIGTMVGMLQCKWPIAPIGEAVGDAPIGGDVAQTPDDALAAFLVGDARHYGTIPLAGWTRLDGSPRWTLFGSLNDDRRVALIVIEHAQPGWVPYQLAACDAADFDQTLPLSTGMTEWVDRDDAPVPAATLTEQPDCYDGTLLRLDGRLYARDLRGGAYNRDELLDSFDIDASLPADAVDTGYRLHKQHLYLATDGKAAFLVSPLRVERWPRVKGDEYTRTDCN